MKFRLLVGGHEQGKGIDFRRYHAKDPKNNIIETDIDLAAKFGFEKFQKLEESQAPAAIRTLESMKLQELIDYAADEEIDLGEAKKKADVLDVIKTWLELATAE